MDENHKLALYVAYYLSRFNEEAYQNLGYRTMNEAHSEIGEVLNTNPHTVKNMRDEFDPYHGHRKGWYQKPLGPSRVKVVNALQDLTEVQVREIVKDILGGKINDEEAETLLSVATVRSEKKTSFILRAPTGRKAEEHFIEFFRVHGLPVSGKLTDSRDLGTGYDFVIRLESEEFFLEVKGLSEVTGGILFTDKEWRIAREKGENYFLVIVSDVNNVPLVRWIRNPGHKLSPKRNLAPIIQINWSVSETEIENSIENDRLFRIS